MSKKLTFLWIDDVPDPFKRQESENLEDRLGTKTKTERLTIQVRFIDVRDKNLTVELNHILSQKVPPGLILMDHMLNNVQRDGYKTGSTAAEVIREKWPECPIVCVTAVPLKDIDSHKKSIYEEVIEFARISDYDYTLLSIATSFQELQKNPPQNTDDFIEMLNAPEEDKVRLKSILPSQLKRKEFYKDNSLFMTISRWTMHTLIERPGFLYDRLWAATLLGIKEESFKKIEDKFTGAEYNGIFADKGNKRWWQTKLREILFSIFPDSHLIYPWELGRQLPEVEEADYSKCYSSGENYPETVAFIDETSLQRKQMRLRYTVAHPGFEKLLFFEEIRMMKGKE